MIRWHKIKINKESKVALEYSESKPGDLWDDFTFTCTDRGQPEFYAAFQALEEHVVEMCELPSKDLELRRITVKGVSFSYGGDRETMGATISAARKLERSSSPLNLLTPHKPSEPYSAGQERDVNGMLSEDCLEALKALQFEAGRYLGGARTQISLFDDKAEPLPASAAA